MTGVEAEGLIHPAGRPDDEIVAFGPFRLHPAARLLVEGDSEVVLGSHAFDILVLLVRRRGEVVRKETLAAHVWPGATVDDVKLRVHVSALRRALGDGVAGRRYIVTLAGRGYQFVAALSSAAGSVPHARRAAPPRSPGLPAPVARIIGRAGFQAQALVQLQERRFVTIVGPGGIGKTTVAVAVANALQTAFPDGVHFLDLAAIASPALLPASLALALGLSNFAAEAAPGVIAWLSHRRVLLVLDSCERVVDGAAVLAEQVLRAAPGVHVLATSREPLRAEGERVLRLPALDLPPQPAGLTASAALEYPAVQLFIERASALLDQFEFRDADAPAVAKICSRLGGIALAIELAAGHVATFDLQTLADLLDDRLGLLTRGRRTALPRHQTMRAVLAWSYETLHERESLVLRRLAVFEAAFSLQAACAVAGQHPLDAESVMSGLGNLVDKSLISAEIREAGVEYRLLDTTRAYALEKLDAGGERAAAGRWHARHVLAVFQDAPVEWGRQAPTAWLRTYRRETANALAALDWAFSSEGELGLALDLSTAVAPILFEVSLVQECRTRAARALDALALADPGSGRSMLLRAALGAALMYADGPLPSTVAVWRTVLDEAVSTGNLAFESRALWALWTASIYHGEPREALGYAQRFTALVTRIGDAARMLMGERIIGVCLHVLGDQSAAHSRLEHVVRQYSPGIHRWHTLGSQIDHSVMARSVQSRIAWLQGCPDRALELRAQALDAVRAGDHAISLCYVLSGSAIPVAWEAGNHAAARQALSLLQESSAENGLSIWQATARCLEHALRDPNQAPPTVEELQSALQDLHATGYLFHRAWLGGLLAQVAGRLHDPGAGLSMVDDALAGCERTGESWCVPELLRIKAVLARHSATASGDISALLDRAAGMARSQGALAWELRIAMTVLDAAGPAGRPAARSQLEAVLSRFGEGFGTADLVAARALLSS